MEYDIGDTVHLISKTEATKEKQRIVKMTEYPQHPDKNTCELSNVTKSFAQLQEETEEKNEVRCSGSGTGKDKENAE